MSTASSNHLSLSLPAPLPVQLVIGPTQNGVVEYARDLASVLQVRHPGATSVVVGGLGEAQAIAEERGRIHLHVSDRIFGSSAEHSALAVESLARSAAVTVTLHDLPQVSDGAANLERRSEAYRRIVVAARGCVVGSRHEAELVRAHLGADLPYPVVVPLGVHDRKGATGSPRVATRADDVVIAGYFYPGKGHEEVVDAIAALAATDGARPMRLTGLGAIAGGHERECERLALTAGALGIEFSMTGYLDRAEYHARLVSARVPVAAHQHLSASRSILDWIEAGRRPLVPDTRYTRELAALRPGVVTLYPPGALAEAIGRAFAHPESTELEAGTDLGYSLADAADDYVRWWSAGVSW